MMTGTVKVVQCGSERRRGEVVARFRGGISLPTSLEKTPPKKLNSLLKWHTATSAGYFSPYIFTLNMINKGTHWERRKKDDNKSSPCELLPYASVGSAFGKGLLSAM